MVCVLTGVYTINFIRIYSVYLSQGFVFEAMPAVLVTELGTILVLYPDRIISFESVNCTVKCLPATFVQNVFEYTKPDSDIYNEDLCVHEIYFLLTISFIF